MRAQPPLICVRRGDLCRGGLAGLGLALMGIQACAFAQDISPGATTGGRSAAGWQISPSLSVSEHFSDNIALVPANAARSEWTTRIRPAVSVAGNSARLHFNAFYAPEYLVRVVESTSGLSHFLDASGQAELLTRTLFLDLRSRISQQNTSLLGPQTDSNINTTSNRTSIRTYGISPYLRREFAGDAIGEVRYTHDDVRVGSTGGNSGPVSSSTSNRIDMTLSSGPAFKLTTWNLDLSKSHLEYKETGQKVDAQRVSASVGRLFTHEFRLNTSVGYEDSGYLDSLGQKLKGTFWSVGPEWLPSPRTRMSATFGHRYFGASRTFHFDHRSRLTAWALDYSESVTTTRFSQTVQAPSPLAVLTDFQLRNDPQFQDPALRQAEVQKRVAATPGGTLTEPLNFLSEALFKEKRLQGTLGIYGKRNSVLSSMFLTNRTALSGGAGTGADFSLSQSVKQSGASLVWNLRLTGTRVSSVSLATTRHSFSGLDRTDRLAEMRWSLTEQLSPRATGSINLGRRKNDSNQALTGYLENSISVTLGVRY